MNHGVYIFSEAHDLIHDTLYSWRPTASHTPRAGGCSRGGDEKRTRFFLIVNGQNIVLWRRVHIFLSGCTEPLLAAAADAVRLHGCARGRGFHPLDGRGWLPGGVFAWWRSS